MAWKPVKDFEGYYEVSDDGEVRSLDRPVRSRWGGERMIKGVVLKQATSKKGYKTIVLHKNKLWYQKQVHRLVAEAFIPNPLNLPQVNHKDTDKANNKVDNLEWITGVDNIRHAFANGCFKRTQRKVEHAREVQLECAIKKRRCVAMIDCDTGETIGIFRSIIDAERATGISNSKITCVCKGKRHQTGGYKWKYMEDIE